MVWDSIKVIFFGHHPWAPWSSYPAALHMRQPWAGCCLLISSKRGTMAEPDTSASTLATLDLCLAVRQPLPLGVFMNTVLGPTWAPSWHRVCHLMRVNEVLKCGPWHLRLVIAAAHPFTIPPYST